MIGRTLAHYEVVELLGKGGMGEVYRARDTKLGRDVALKLLPEDLGRDPERLARFRREAQVLAALNHRNVAGIHGLEDVDGLRFLVMELAPGEDLAQRLARGAVPVDEVVSIARQLAEGLEQAHERGVVHRDLKPANVKLAEDGTVKILDFGLARAYAGESAAEGDIGTSPTITAAMTQAGTILGTAAYMSPEQARGKEVDRRADIWAFGVILYELLVGGRLFDGETISDTLAEVLKSEPDLDRLPADTPPALRWLIERCLRKKPGQRLRDIGEARVLLEADLDEVPASTIGVAAAAATGRPAWLVPVLVGLAVVAAGLGALGVRVLEPSADAPRGLHVSLLPPADQAFEMDVGGHLDVSPDGSQAVFAARDTNGVRRLWVRRLDRSAAFVLSGTENATYPFWSPDGTEIGFFADGRLKRIDATGGVATTVCAAPNGRGGSWSPDDRIVFAFEIRNHLQIVPASGGTPTALTTMDSLHWSHRWPHVMPSGEHFVYVAAGPTDELRWGAIDDPSEGRVLLPDVENAAFADGHLFLVRDRALWARPFDPERGEFTGDEVLVAEAVWTDANFDRAVFAVGRDGTLVYLVGVDRQSSAIGVLDSTGRVLERIEIEQGAVQDLDLSPDGRRLAFTIVGDQEGWEGDVWVRDLQRGTMDRFATGADDAVWGPDGERLVYSERGDIVFRSARGDRAVLGSTHIVGDALPQDWTRTGDRVVVTLADDGTRLIAVPFDDPDGWTVVVQNEEYKTHAAFSPDGEWLAYTQVVEGSPRVFLRDLRPGGSTWPVSGGRAAQPRFASDGTGLYFLNPQGMWRVDLRLTSDEPEFGRQRRLFEEFVPTGRTNTHRYDVSPDGSRFYVELDPRTEDSRQRTLDLVVDWRAVRGLTERDGRR